MKSYWVYILRCRDGSYYTGITNNIERRLEEHSLGIDGRCYTVKRRPVKLMYKAEFRDVGEAIAYEKQIKRWSRAKKEAMIHGYEEQLHMLAVCKNDTYFKYREINLIRIRINGNINDALVSSRAKTRDRHF
jgi:putative endonuclease